MFVLRLSFRLWFSFFDYGIEGPKQGNKETPSLKFACLVSGGAAIPKIVYRSCHLPVARFCKRPFSALPSIKIANWSFQPQQKRGMAMNSGSCWHVCFEDSCEDGSREIRTEASSMSLLASRDHGQWTRWSPAPVLRKRSTCIEFYWQIHCMYLTVRKLIVSINDIDSWIISL